MRAAIVLVLALGLAVAVAPAVGRNHMHRCGDVNVSTGLITNIKANFRCASARRVVKKAKCVDIAGGCDRIRYRKFRGRRITIDSNTNRLKLHHNGKKVTAIVHVTAD